MASHLEGGLSILRAPKFIGNKVHLAHIHSSDTAIVASHFKQHHTLGNTFRTAIDVYKLCRNCKLDGHC